MSDGGPAFPIIETNLSQDEWTNERYPDVYSCGGMTLRDYFAGQALTCVFATADIEFGDFEVLARSVYEVADLMIAEKEKREGAMSDQTDKAAPHKRDRCGTISQDIARAAIAAMREAEAVKEAADE